MKEKGDATNSEKESNWLPAPAAPSCLCLRMYLPKPDSPSILNGTWAPPPLVREG